MTGSAPVPTRVATLHNKTVPLSQALAVSEAGYHIIQKWKFLHCYFSVIVHTFCLCRFQTCLEWELLRARGSAEFLRVLGNAALFLSRTAGWAASAGRRRGAGRRRVQRDLSPALAAMGGGDQALLGATSSDHAVAAALSPGPWERQSQQPGGGCSALCAGWLSPLPVPGHGLCHPGGSWAQCPRQGGMGARVWETACCAREPDEGEGTWGYSYSPLRDAFLMTVLGGTCV